MTGPIPVVDPDSPRGIELAAQLTETLGWIRHQIATRKRMRELAEREPAAQQKAA